MKKLFALILTIAMLMTAAAAIAEGQGGPMGGPQQGQQDDRGQQPPEKPAGEKPADAPEKPSGEKGQQAPEKTSGKKPADGQQPRKADDKRIDFDAMVTSGVISQETRDSIMAYMDEHKPEGEPADRQHPDDDQQPPEKPADDQSPADGQAPDLLSDLLNAGVITQAEYEALAAAQTAA